MTKQPLFIIRNKTYTLGCRVCGKRQVFKGQDVDEILVQINEAGWLDDYDPLESQCPQCLSSEEPA